MKGGIERYGEGEEDDEEGERKGEKGEGRSGRGGEELRNAASVREANALTH